MKILVISLPTGRGLPVASVELIGGAKHLMSRAGGTVEVAIIGHEVSEACGEASAFGADVVCRVDDEALSAFDAEAYLQALQVAVRESSPEAVLFTADNRSGELAPRLAHRLGTGAITEAAGMEVAGDGQLVFTRPVYGGHLLAEMEVNCLPAVATIMPGSVDSLARDESRSVEVRTLQVEWTSGIGLVKVLEAEREEEVGIPLEGARVVVSGGRGMGDPANFQSLEELAALLGGAVGASRGAVDEGWVSPSRQVGQTGRKVAPDLYIAVGISGASQHLAGMSRAKHVVVINTDPGAAFFRVAEVGVVADHKKLLPPLTARLRELLRNN